MYTVFVEHILLPLKTSELFQTYNHVSALFWSWFNTQISRCLHLQWLFLWPLCVAEPLTFTEQIQTTQLLGSHFGVPGIPAIYDYVIVGGGTAGLVMARRLAADASFTVAVIEAGGFYELDNGNFSEIPAFAAQFTRQ